MKKIKPSSAFFNNTKRHILEDEKNISKNAEELLGFYEKAVMETEDRIHALYSKFAKENKMTIKEAREFITSSEQKVFNKTIAEYMKIISEEGENSLTKIELDKLSIKARLTREEKLLADIYMEMGKMADVSNEELEKVLKETLKTSFKRSAFDVQNAMGVYYRVNMLSDPAINLIVNRDWAKQKFSSAIWSHVDNLNAHVKEVLTDGFIQGKSIDKMVRSLKERTDVARGNVERLIKTECKYFANQGELEGYKANGIRKYVFIGDAETDSKCNCSFYSNKIIDVDKAEALLNFPPLHPNCKCSIRAYFEDSILDNNKDKIYLENGYGYSAWEEEQLIKPIELKFNTSDGIIEMSVSKHAMERIEQRGVTLKDMRDAIENPLEEPKLRLDAYNKKSIRYLGKKATVNVNPLSNNIVTIWKTSSKKKSKKGG